MKNHSRQIVALSGLFAVWCLPLQTRGAIVTNLIDSFDSDTVGACPAGWNCTAAHIIDPNSFGYAIVTNNIFQSSPNSFAMVNTNANGTDWLADLRNLPIPIAGNFNQEVDVFYRINLAQTNGYTDLILTDGSTATFLNFGFNGLGQIRANTQLVANYSSNTWYDVHLHFVPQYQKYDAYVSTNGALYASITSVPFGGSGLNFDLFYFQNFGSMGHDTAFTVDNVAVFSGIPEPSSLGIGSLGLLGMLGMKRVCGNVRRRS